MEFSKFTPALIDAVKNLSSNEPVLINEKNKPVYSARLGVRLLFVSNKVPHISDYSDAFWRRCLLVHCLACIRGRENLHLIDELKTESAGIFNWLLEGAVDLVKNKGHIDVAPAIHQAVARQRRVMDPHKVFIEEELIETSHDQWIPGVLSLYPYYQRWMDDRGHDGVLSWPNLKLRLEEIYPRVEDEQKRHPINQGRTCRGIAGIFWRDEEEAKARYLDDIANEAIKKAYAKALKDLKIDTSEGRRRFREKFQRENAKWLRLKKKKQINPSSSPVTERRVNDVTRNEIDELLKQFEGDDEC